MRPLCYHTHSIIPAFISVMASYDLRQRVKKNYRELSDTKLPRASRQSSKQNSDELYTIEIIEEREDEVRIHYVGYSSKHDEWRSRCHRKWAPGKISSPGANGLRVFPPPGDYAQ